MIVLKAATGDNADDIDGDDPEAVKLLIDFMYLHDYEAQRIPLENPATPSMAEGSGGFRGFTPRSRGRGSVAGGRDWRSRRPRSPSLSPDDVRMHEEKHVPTALLELQTDFNTVMHAKMYALGSKYGVDALKAAAQCKFKFAVEKAWNQPGFVRAIGIVYSTTA